MLHPGFQKALAYLTSDNVRSLLTDLVDISSPTGNEIGVAQYLTARMRRIGMDTDLPLVDAGRPDTAADPAMGSNPCSPATWTRPIPAPRSISPGKDFNPRRFTATAGSGASAPTI